MPLRFLRRNSGSKKTQSLDVVAQRFCKAFQNHGVEKSQIPRLIPQITLGDLTSNKALLDALTPEILDQTARLFGIRIEWLEGVDDDIYEYRHCYKEPELLLELLATLRNRADFDITRFPLRVLVSSRNLDGKVSREQLLVPVVLEKVADLGDEPIYRYYIFNDGFNWGYDHGRIQLKAMVRMVYKILGSPVPLMVINPADLQRVHDQKKVPREVLDGCLLTNPSLEDFSLTSQESGVAAEVDEMPWVLKYIEDHKLESHLARDPHPTSPLQDAPLEAQPSEEPPTPATIAPKTGKRAENKAHWKSVEEAARILWAQDGSLPIAEVISRIQGMPHLKASAFTSSAIRKHIADLAPAEDAGKPGRKPNKSP